MSIELKWFSKKGPSGGILYQYIKDGVIYIDNFSEELDSATVVLTQQTQKLNFESFDLVELKLPNIGTKTMLINDFVENQINLENGLYEYTLNLMSLTKELERTTLPNISITKPKHSDAKTVYNVINEILSDYSPKYIDVNRFGANPEFTDLYEIAPDEIILGKCPDLQITKPTLRNAIDTVLSVKNSICYLDSDRYLRIMNLNSRGNEITLNEYYNYQPENQSANDYATESENNYNNVVPNNIPGIKNDSIVSEYIGFRSEQMILTDENAVLITQNPIYDLKSLYLNVVVNIQGISAIGVDNYVRIKYENQYYYVQVFDAGLTSSRYFNLNIVNYIVEEQDYNILNYETKKHRGYFSRGNNKIQGLLNYKKTFLENYVTSKLIIEDISFNEGNQFLVGEVKNNVLSYIQSHSGVTINENLIQEVKLVKHVTNDVAAADIAIPDTYFEINWEKQPAHQNYVQSFMFKIVYEAQNENLRMRSGKYLPETNQNNIIVDNPSEAYVDIKRQGELFNDKCNRLGNRVKIIQARFPINYQYIPQLSDYIGNYVLIRRELQFYDNYILFKGTLTENYVNINYFTGINARKRSWNIVSAGEAFDKELLDKWFCEFSFSNKQKYTVDNLMFSGDMALRLLNVFHHEHNATHFEHFLLSNGYTYQGENGNAWNYIELDMTTYISGNSIIVNATTGDNYSAGIKIESLNGGGENLDLPVESYCKYVDSNGFANNFEIRLMSNLWITGYGYYDFYNLTNGSQVVSGQDSGNRYDALKATSYNKPKALIPTYYYTEIINETCLYAVNFINHKDSREKLGFNIQFEFCSDTPNIILGEAFMERQELVNNGTGFYDRINFYGSPDEYKITEKIKKSNATIWLGQNENTIQTAIDGLTASFRMIVDPQVGDVSYKSISVVGEDGRLIMAVNTSSRDITIYLNMLKTRDRHKYIGSDLKSWFN